jgi:23S rRNA (uracil1939-C5)-methyltransferase
MIYGGAALGHHDGRPVLVPFSLPGERIEVEPQRTAKGMVHARTVRVLSSAQGRVEPPCPYFGICGGCHYQHLDASLQTRYKQEILRETFRRIGRIVWNGEIRMHAAGAWNYRNQARLKVMHTAAGNHEIGFFEGESHRLTSIDACLILSPRLNVILAELLAAEWSRYLEGCREIEMLADDRDNQVMISFLGDIDSEAAPLLAAKAACLPGVASIAVQQRQRFKLFGEPSLTYVVGEYQYQLSPGSFFQASRFLLPEFVSAATVGVGNMHSTESEIGAMSAAPATLALDLYAGVGLFALPLARQFNRVIAVESNARAVADLSANAERHGLSNVSALHQSAFDFLRRFAQREPDLVVLDPPRAGSGMPTLKLLAALRPKSIHYASCHPPTLARDAGFLIERGYRIDWVELFDFFPQTYHIETLVRFTPQAA